MVPAASEKGMSFSKREIPETSLGACATQEKGEAPVNHGQAATEQPPLSHCRIAVVGIGLPRDQP